MKIKDQFSLIKDRIPEMEISEICDEIGGGYPYVSYLCQVAGIKPKHFNDKPVARRFKNSMPELGGKTRHEIMEIVNCSRSYMFNLCRINGIVPADKGMQIFWDELVVGINSRYKTNHKTVKAMLEWLYDKYPSSIAMEEILGVCHQTILTKMHELGLESKSWNNRNAEERRAWQAQRKQFQKPIL